MIKTIGHRFFAEHNPENSDAGLSFAVNNKAWAVETDVQLTRDKVPIIMHDKTLDRTTNFSGAVNSFTYDELKNCRLSNGDKILTLRRCLDRLSGTDIHLYLELISDKHYEVITKMIKEYQTKIRIVLSSFHHSLLKNIKENNKSQVTMSLFECNPINAISFFKETMADEVGIGFESISASLVDDFISQGIDAFAWTVNNKSDINIANEMGLTGIFSDKLPKK